VIFLEGAAAIEVFISSWFHELTLPVFRDYDSFVHVSFIEAITSCGSPLSQQYELLACKPTLACVVFLLKTARNCYCRHSDDSPYTICNARLILNRTILQPRPGVLAVRHYNDSIANSHQIRHRIAAYDRIADRHRIGHRIAALITSHIAVMIALRLIYHSLDRIAADLSQY
jgi:hypothetical protein